MSKSKFVVISVLVLAVVLLTAVLSASAQGPDGSGWWTNFTIQNTSAGDATVSTTVYDSNSGDTSSNSVVVPQDMSVIFHPGLSANCTDPVTLSGCRIGVSPVLSAGFEGSAVISSDAPVVAVTSLNNNSSGTVGAELGTARSSYQGIAGNLTAATLYFPTVKYNFSGQTTVFFVQAAGSDADVTITYEMNDGTTHIQTQLITANKMFAFLPSAATPAVESCGGGNGGGSAVAKCFGGATVTSSTGPIAGVVVEYVDGASVASYVLATRGLTPSDAGTDLIAPTMKSSFNGSSTGATILNTGLASATVDLEFAVTATSGACDNAPGDVVPDQITIDPGKSVVVNANNDNIGGLDACTFFSMVATSDQDIVMTVNENRVVNGQKVKAVYAGFNKANATDTVSVPLAKEFFNGQTTGVSVVNAGAAPAKITATYTSSTGSYSLTTADDVPVGGAVSFFNVSGANAGNFTGDALPASEKYSVVFTSVEPIVGLSQESDRDFSNGILDVTNYEGFNQ
jgi:hypothetical protein